MLIERIIIVVKSNYSNKQYEINLSIVHKKIKKN